MDIEKEKQILRQILPAICAADTSQSRKEWNFSNPFRGHCAVVALLAQDVLGGEILWASLEGTKWSGNHYWNLLPGGEEVDFTGGQFEGNRPKLKGEIRTRAFLLASKDTQEKYVKLAKKYAKERNAI